MLQVCTCWKHGGFKQLLSDVAAPWNKVLPALVSKLKYGCLMIFVSFICQRIKIGSPTTGLFTCKNRFQSDGTLAVEQNRITFNGLQWLLMVDRFWTNLLSFGV